MLLSHRTVELPDSETQLATHAVVHSGYRMHAVFRRNVVSEDALLVRGFDRRGAVGRPAVTVLLEGKAKVRVPEGVEDLIPGDLCLIARKGAVLMRQEGPRYRAVMCEWEPGKLGGELPTPLSKQRASAATLRELETVASALSKAGDDATKVTAPVTRAWAALRDAGVPLAPSSEADLCEPVSDAIAKLGRALDTLQSNLHGAPMMIDLEKHLGLSARQLNRLVSEFNERYGFNASGWRDTRNRWRLLMGATLMTAPDATAATVANAVGFASTSTFCRALANVGLPAPGEIEAVVRSLA
ncbi:MAG: AraC family transcriptional regulator [Polyangiaceae bacterium]